VLTKWPFCGILLIAKFKKLKTGVFALDIVIDIIYSVATFFIMMIPGIILKKARMADNGIGKGLSNLVLYIAQPALIFVSYLRDFSLDILINALYRR
jgi:hypothetical protein